MSAVAIRTAQPEDVGTLRALLLQLAEFERMSEKVTGTEAQLRDALFGPLPVLEGLIAESNGVALGYALFYPTFGSFSCTRGLWLEDLFVVPEARGMGAGRALLSSLARLALARGCGRLRWDVLDWNAPAIGFYERIGATRAQADWYEYGLGRDGLERLATSPD